MCWADERYLRNKSEVDAAGIGISQSNISCFHHEPLSTGSGFTTISTHQHYIPAFIPPHPAVITTNLIIGFRENLFLKIDPIRAERENCFYQVPVLKYLKFCFYRLPNFEHCSFRLIQLCLYVASRDLNYSLFLLSFLFLN